MVAGEDTGKKARDRLPAAALDFTRPRRLGALGRIALVPLWRPDLCRANQTNGVPAASLLTPQTHQTRVLKPLRRVRVRLIAVARRLACIVVARVHLAPHLAG